MDKNNLPVNQEYTGKDDNGNANQKNNEYVNNKVNENPTAKPNSGLGKGTGLSSEANSSQSEESWQDMGGSMANETQQKNLNQNDNGHAS